MLTVTNCAWVISTVDVLLCTVYIVMLSSSSSSSAAAAAAWWWRWWWMCSSSVPGFCRHAVYSLTTDYNNGALRCDCNPDGSVSFNCDEFGGQCRCKRDIIGRTCSHCRTGYYGFPDCRRMMTAHCHSSTSSYLVGFNVALRDEPFHTITRQPNTATNTKLVSK